MLLFENEAKGTFFVLRLFSDPPIGRLKSVSAVVPLPNVNCKLPNSQNSDSPSVQEDSSEKVQQSTTEIESDNWLPPVDTHLEPEQRCC